MEEKTNKGFYAKTKHRKSRAWAVVAIVAIIVGALMLLVYNPPENIPPIKFASPDIFVDVPKPNDVCHTNVINITAPVTAQIEPRQLCAEPLPVFNDTAKRDVVITQNDKDDALAALVLINHINWVVTKIKTHNNPAVLEEEYKNISQNSLLLDAIKDEEIITLICDIMDAVVELRIDAKKRDMLKEELDQAMSDAMYDAMSGVSVSGSTPLGMAVSALTSVATAAANYKRAKRNLEKNHKKQTFALDEAKMRYLNELNKSLLKNYWFVIQKYGIPDPYRVTEDDIAYLIDRLKDVDSERRFRFLVGKEKRYAMLPNYWYWRGQTAYELGNYDAADTALENFQTLQKRGCKVLRYDTTAANVALLRAKIMVDKGVADISRIREQLSIIDENSSDDEWQKKYFCAMVYAQHLRDIGSAETVLRPAIDKMESDRSGQLVVMRESFEERRSENRNDLYVPTFGDALYACKTLLLESKIATIDDAKRQELLEGICSSQTASARDKLFCYCSLGYGQALETIVPDIKKMRVFCEEKKLKLLLPMSWVVTRDGAPDIHLIKDNSVDLISLDFNRFYNSSEKAERELCEFDGLQYAKLDFGCNWKDSKTLIVTFRYNRCGSEDEVRDCYQIAVSFDISRHDGRVRPNSAAFGLWSSSGWKSPAQVSVQNF